MTRRRSAGWSGCSPGGRAWIAQLEEALDADVDAGTPAAERGDRLAATITETLASRPMLCDLVSVQAAVIERNVSTQVVATYKRSAAEALTDLVRVVRAHLPELGEPAARQFVTGAVLLTGAIWTHANPAEAVLAVYQAEPEVAALRVEFGTALRDLLQVLIAGLLARE